MNIANLFGPAATLDTTTPANPSLTTDFDSVKSAGSWTTAPTSALDSAAQWLLAIIQTAKAYIDTITDNTNTVTIGNPTVSVQTINGNLTTVYSYSVGFRVPFSGTATPDPDDI